MLLSSWRQRRWRSVSMKLTANNTNRPKMKRMHPLNIDHDGDRNEKNDNNNNNNKNKIVMTTVKDPRVPSPSTSRRPLSARHLASNASLDVQRSDAFRLLVLTPKWFAFCWWMLAACRGGSIAFLMAMTWLYLWFLWDVEVQQNLGWLVRFDFELSKLGILIWFFALLALLHAIALVHAVWFAVRSGRLVFDNDPTLPDTVDENAGGQQPGWRCCGPSFVSWKRKWIDPVFTPRGKFFDEYFVLKEVLEIGCQIYQAYQMSRHVAAPSLNNIYTSMLVLNCCSTPLVHWVVPASKPQVRRFLNVILSALLTFVNSVVIPLAIFVPYVRAFDKTLNTFQGKYMDDWKWFVKAQSESQQLFVTSYFDFLSTWIPHWCVFSSLATCEGFLGRCERRNAMRVIGIAPPSSQSVGPIVRDHLCQEPRATAAKKSSTKQRLGLHLIWITGIIVLSIHITAQSVPDVAGCNIILKPWLETKGFCAYLNVMCIDLAIQGTEDELDAYLSKLDPRVLTNLYFNDCPKLQVPPRIQEFRHLESILVLNCTLDRWPREAALEADRFSELQNVYFVDANLTSIPEGLRTGPLPLSVWVVYFNGCTLTTLPDDLHEFWGHVMYLEFLWCQFEEFPATLSKMNAIDLFLTGNPMTSTESTIRINDHVQVLDLSSSLLSSLPNATIGSLQHLTTLNLEYTQLMHVPDYVQQWYLNLIRQNQWVSHSLRGSPYCDQLVSIEEDPDEFEYQSRVCLNSSITAMAG